MKTVAVSEFKARCLAILAEAQKTGEPVVVTKRGKPLARILPVGPGPDSSWLDSLKGTAEIRGDLVEPATAPEEWESLRH